ncbi:MAG: LytTR family DNA-binding domain-containing protein [Parvularculaceae bacterium]
MLRKIAVDAEEVWRQAAVFSTALLVGFLSVVSYQQKGPSLGQLVSVERAPFVELDSYAPEATPWRPATLYIGARDNAAATLRIVYRVTPELANGSRPLALSLSGRFASETYLNGVRLGANGRPAAEPSDEIPGAIDAAFPIPDGLIKPGENEFLIAFSAHSNILEYGMLLQRLELGYARADSRRPISQYTAPIIAIGLLIFTTLFLSGLREPAPPATPMLLLSAIAAAGFAEISRSLINYPYPYHFLRIGVLAAAGFACGFLMWRYARSRWAPALSRRWDLLVLLALIAVMLTARTLDPFAARVFAIGAGAALIVLAAARLRGANIPLGLAASLAVFALLAIFDDSLFLDRWLYVASIPIAANILWIETAARAARAARAAPALRRPAAGQPDLDRLRLKSRRGVQLIPLDAIRSIHGAGNYVEIALADGRQILHTEKLNNLADKLPGNFFRLHRSHIVNLTCVETLHGGRGGKYAVRLFDGSELPVARSRVADLRRRISI